MKIISYGPLRAASLIWKSPSGAWVETVVCKATFDLTPGVARLSKAQEPPNEDDNYWNDDSARSLLAPNDLAPLKARADVLLVGNAFTPRREPFAVSGSAPRGSEHRQVH